MPYMDIQGVRHYQKEDGDLWVPSVTEIIDVWRDPGLEAWQIRYCVKEGDEKASERYANLHASYGTTVHDYLEGGIEQAEFYDPPQVRSAMSSWQLFKSEVDIKILRTKLEVFGPGYGGTADLLVSMNGIPTLLEIKTSAALRNRAALQAEAYFRAYPEAERVFGLRLGKNKIEYELREPDHDKCWEAFQACQTLFHLSNPWTTESAFFVPISKPLETKPLYEFA